MSTRPALAPRQWAAGVASAVFAFGFGMLALASALGFGEQSLPGLFTFRSATVGDGILAFYNDLQNQGLLGNTLMMQFSEFGRRISENGSQGTDHGAGSDLEPSPGRRLR